MGLTVYTDSSSHNVYIVFFNIILNRFDFRVGFLMHPSPINPLANKGKTLKTNKIRICLQLNKT